MRSESSKRHQRAYAREYQRRYRQTEHGKAVRKANANKPDHRTKRLAYYKKWYKEHPERYRESSWKRRGLPTPTRPEPERCEICGNPESGRFKHLALDHSHETGKFRGWLCHRCNKGLGLFKDNPVILACALEYIKGNQ